MRIENLEIDPERTHDDVLDAPAEQAPAHEFARRQHEVAAPIERAKVTAHHRAGRRPHAPRDGAHDIAMAKRDQRNAEITRGVERNPPDEARILRLDDVRLVPAHRAEPRRYAKRPPPRPGRPRPRGNEL